jgi:glycosyltransferase involved in cell wall biosynthesis
MSRPEIAVVHDYLTQRGGAERVVLSMMRMFPDAPLYTSLYEPDSTYPEFADYDIRPMVTNHLSSLRRNHRRGILLYPFAFSRLRVDADVVLCSSSGFAHGVRTTGRKVVYCYTPARWLYDETDTYVASWTAPVAVIVRVAGPALRCWDRRAARSAEMYLTSSVVVRDRIKRTYGIDATVVAPPVCGLASMRSRSIPGIDPGFVLCVSRLLAYKNVEAVSAAFEELPHVRLVIVGTGPEYDRLAALAGTNVLMLGRVDDVELAWLYAACAGVVAAAHEDFGLTPVEAASCGKPVAALRSGGFLETVIEGKTGIFFDEPDCRSIASAVRGLLEHSWDTESIEDHAASFVESFFSRRLMEAVGAVMNSPSQPDYVASMIGCSVVPASARSSAGY